MRILVKILLILIMMGLTLSLAEPITCQTTTTTIATGYGYTEANSKFNAALADAMATAIGQVNGLFVNSKTQLTDYFQTTTSNGLSEINSSSELTEEIREQFNGLIEAFQVTGQTITDGVLAVTISADICTDPRVALIVRGPEVAARSFTESFSQHLQQNSWDVQPVYQQFSSYLTVEDQLDVSLKTGASYIVDVSLFVTDKGQSRGNLQAVDVALNGTVYDIRTFDVLFATTPISQTAKGLNFDNGQQLASNTLGSHFAKELDKWFYSDVQTTGTLTFTGVGRTNTQHNLTQILSNTSGISSVYPPTFDANSQQVTISVETQRNFCDVIADVVSEARSFQILIGANQCANNIASLEVLRE